MSKNILKLIIQNIFKQEIFVQGDEYLCYSRVTYEVRQNLLRKNSVSSYNFKIFFEEFFTNNKTRTLKPNVC